MCGIFGIISAGISKANTDTIPILKALGHRGPDENGVAIMDGCLLAPHPLKHYRPRCRQPANDVLRGSIFNYL